MINFFNHLWRPALSLAERLGLKAPTAPQNWLSTRDMVNLLALSGWEVIKTDARILWPLRTPLGAEFCKCWLAPLLPALCLTSLQVARLKRCPRAPRPGRCSVIVPARNEAGNIEAVAARTPEMGAGTELIFVEGGSHDGSWSEVERIRGRFRPS